MNHTIYSGISTRHTSGLPTPNASMIAQHNIIMYWHAYLRVQQCYSTSELYVLQKCTTMPTHITIINTSIIMAATLEECAKPVSLVMQGCIKQHNAVNSIFRNVTLIASMPIRVILRTWGIYCRSFFMYNAYDIMNTITVISMHMIRNDIELPAFLMKLASGIIDFYAAYY